MVKNTKDGQARLTPDRSGIGVEELRILLAEEGYSGDRREGWLKEVLTSLAMDQDRAPTKERERLIDEIKQIVGTETGAAPMTDDVL